VTDLTPYQLYVTNSLTALVFIAVLVGFFVLLTCGLLIAKAIGRG
jgi:hypothetical protein